MSRWSEAPVKSLAPGDGGHPGGTGALRSVDLGPAGLLRELVVHGDPGERLVYRAIDAPLVREHLGTQRIEADGAGSRITWHVRATLASSTLERVMAAQLRRSVGRSLDTLVRLAAEPHANLPTRPLPPRRALDESRELPRLLAEAKRTRLAQWTWAERLLATDDDRGWFGRVYAHVTDEIALAVEAGRFEHPAWVLRLVLAFHPLWEAPLRARLEDAASTKVPAHWARGHAAAERARTRARTRYERAVLSILGGMRAHIEGDLPVAIASVHHAHYAGRADLARFRADYLLMAPLFDRAGERIQAAFPRREWGLRARLYDRLTPEFLRPTLIDRTVYPITRERRRAFAAAERLVSGPASG